jgi:hypothetical protein
MLRPQTRNGWGSGWKHRTRQPGRWDLLFILVGLATAGGLGYTLLGLIGTT